MTPVLRAIASLILKLGGWTVDGAAPDTPKYVVIFAPHTSNWDLPMVIIYALVLRVTVWWLGKSSLFRGPLDWVFRWLAGIPVDRRSAHNVVAQTVAMFAQRDRFAVGIAPAGTRKQVSEWKTGFYHIARGANMPIALSYVDYRLKRGGIARLVTPTGDLEQDVEAMQSFYKGVTGKRRVATEAGS